MTRTYIKLPVWAWHCDICGRIDRRLKMSQSDLPTPAQMRSEGWLIAEKWGDECPACTTPEGSENRG